MTSGQYSFCLLLNADWLIQISEGLAVCKDVYVCMLSPRVSILNCKKKKKKTKQNKNKETGKSRSKTKTKSHLYIRNFENTAQDASHKNAFSVPRALIPVKTILRPTCIRTCVGRRHSVKTCANLRANFDL